MQPAETDVGLEGILAVGALLGLNRGEQGRDDLREAMRGGRGGGRGALGAVGRYLRLGARRVCEAWMRRQSSDALC